MPVNPYLKHFIFHTHNINMDNPLVSVMMVTYNHEHYISQAIEGVLMQITSFRIELVIGEDCSTDSTRKICEKYKNQYPQLIRLLTTDHNLGMVQNGNRTLQACTGKYIALNDGDDYWTDPYKLQKQVDFLESNEDYGLVWTDIDFRVQSSGVINKSVFKNKKLPIYDSFIETLIHKPFFSPSTWLCRREYLQQEINNYCDGTFPMILDILSKTKIKYLEVVTATYRQLDESASASQSMQKRYNFLKGVYRIQKDYIKKYNVSIKIEEEIDFKHFESAYPYAVILGDLETVEKGKLIFKNRLHINMKVKGALFLSNFFIGRSMLKIIYKSSLLKQYLANLPFFYHST